MDELKRYDILYTDAAARDIMEKTDYILYRLHDVINAESWYQNLKTGYIE